jgi:hypothetical protein
MSKKFLIDIDMGGVARVINLLDGVNPQDAVTKAQLDAAVQGLNWKAGARVASTANVNTASPGASIDGVALAASDRVLLKNQTDPAENGLYVWNGAAVAMTRSLDANSASELVNAIVTIAEGTANADTVWRQDTIGISLGVTPLSWVAFGTSAPAASESTAGIAEIATQAETDLGADDARIVTPAKLANWSARKLKSSANAGDGSATQFTLTHNLGTRDVVVNVYRNSAPYDTVECDVERDTANSVVVRFASAPTAAQYRAVVLG